MTASGMATPQVRGAARLTDVGRLSLTEPWMDDRPDPAHWLKTMDLESARRELGEALRAGPDPIVVTGPTGHGKTLLLRSLWSRPPNGFVPLFIPFANVEPDELAGWILETAYRRWDRHPAAELARLLRADVRFGARTLLLMDEVQATPRATLSKLFEIITDSGVAVSVVLAGLPGEALDLLLTALPRSIRKVMVSRPWSRADAELLLAQVALTLGVDPTDLIAAVDVDAALRTGRGNPRLVRAALAARVRLVELPRPRIPPVAAFAAPEPPAQLASAVRPERAPGEPTSAPLAVMVGTFAARSLAARVDRSRQGIAASWRRAVQAFAVGITELQRSTGRRAVCVQAWRVRGAAAWREARSEARGWARRVQAAATSARLALVPRVHRGLTGAAQLLRGTRLPRLPAHSAFAMACAVAALAARMDQVVRSIRTHGHRYGHRMGSVLRDRTSAVSARPRSRTLLRSAAAWSTRLPPFPTRSALAMAGAIAALAAIVADGRVPATLMKPSGHGGGTIGEPIRFRMNSHPWSTVEIDGVVAGTTPFTISLAPGPHHFRAAMADGRILEKVFAVSAQQDRLAFR